MLGQAPSVYLACDVRIYREGLISVLGRSKRISFVGAGPHAEAMQVVQAQSVDVLLLDLGLRRNMDLTGRAIAAVPGLRVVAFAVAEEEKDVIAWAERGASGYVSQDASPEELIAALCRVMEGELVCSPQIAGSLFKRLARPSSGGVGAGKAWAGLTPREREIAEMLARGMANKEVARLLRVGNATIKNHVHNILQKLNLQRRGEIVMVLATDTIRSGHTPVRFAAQSRSF